MGGREGASFTLGGAGRPELGLVIEVGEPSPWLSCWGGSWGQVGTGVDLGLMGLGPEEGGCGDKPGLHCGTASATQRWVLCPM